MDILDNILDLDTYGLKYTQTYYDIHQQEITIEILKRDYEWGVSGLIFLGDGVSMQKNFADEDFFNTIVATQFQLNLAVITGISYREFSEVDNREFLVLLKRNNVYIAFGYIIPETYEENWGAYPHSVSVTVSDGLGQLKDVLFENNDGTKIIGMQRVSDIVSFILDKTGLWDWATGFWIDYIPIRNYYVQSGNEIYGCLYNLYVETSRFYEMNCEEVLTDLLSSFNAKIVQVNTGFMIYCPDEFTSSIGQMYNRQGELKTSAVSYGHTYEINGAVMNGKIAGRADLKIETNPKEIQIIQKKEFQNIVGEIPITDWVPIEFTSNMNFEIVEDVVMFNCERFHAAEQYANCIRLKIKKQEFPFMYGIATISFDYIFKGTVPDDTDMEYIINAIISRDAYVPDWSVNYPSKFTVNKTGNWENCSMEIRTYPTSSSLFIAITQAPTSYTLFEIKNLQIIYKQPPWTGRTEFQEEYVDTINNKSKNTKTLQYEKYYGNRISGDNILELEEYAFANQFFCYRSGISLGWWLASGLWRNLNDSTLTNLTTFIRDKYSSFYQTNKKRISLGIANLDESNQLQPYSKMLLPQLELQCYLLGYEWNLKTDTYSIEVLEQAVYLEPTFDYYVFLGTRQVIYTRDAVVIGQLYGGGVVAYVLQSGDPGYDADYCKGFIVPETDQSVAQVGSNLTDLAGTSNDLGTGQANTTAIIGQVGHTDSAAKLCNDTVVETYSDWYLPSRDELKKCYDNKGIIGGFSSALYWTSSEASAHQFIAVNMADGSFNNYTKTNIGRVRAMRSFSIALNSLVIYNPALDNPS